MAEPNPSLISHVSIGTNRFEQASAFYDAVLGALGARRLMEHPGAVCWGRQLPEFWLQTPIDGEPATLGNGSHFGFVADSREQVHAFWNAALAHGGRPDGEPGPRPDYGAPYYGCFVRDLDGHKIEAAFWDAGPGAA
jgi:catechol 2,3-dioxygenase-like lactoylglutathione lyase family enzyme